jgi:hypothetical protein
MSFVTTRWNFQLMEFFFKSAVFQGYKIQLCCLENEINLWKNLSIYAEK